jgi:hypothetical protein
MVGVKVALGQTFTPATVPRMSGVAARRRPHSALGNQFPARVHAAAQSSELELQHRSKTWGLKMPYKRFPRHGA